MFEQKRMKSQEVFVNQGQEQFNMVKEEPVNQNPDVEGKEHDCNNENSKPCNEVVTELDIDKTTFDVQEIIPVEKGKHVDGPFLKEMMLVLLQQPMKTQY